MNALHVTLDHIHDFDEIVDVRTPLEYAEDHIPGAINAPVLSNEERVVIGTLYTQSRFDATRLGAALVAKNIGRHLETQFADRPRQWRPLVYCWRGGKRSEAMSTWFNLIGWQARQLEGGYKTYRRWVLETVQSLPGRFHYVILTGPTGTGKTRLLHALKQAGAQTLDLEDLSCHRGSLLGALPGQSQPSQKKFDSRLVDTLRPFDPNQPVFAEAESARIGSIDIPKSLLDPLHAGVCVDVAANIDERLEFLLQDYGPLFEQPEDFKQQLTRLTGLHSKKTILHWHELIDHDARAELFGELIAQHYDPAYARSSHQHFQGLANAMRFTFRPNTGNALDQAKTLLEQLKQTHNGAGQCASSPVLPEERQP